MGATKVAVFTVVNAIGAVVNRQGEVVYGYHNRQDGRHFHAITEVEQLFASGLALQTQPGNTTLTVVITNQKLNRFDLTQLGRQVHSSMARAIQPFHTIYDGDVLYAVTTNEIENPKLNSIALGIVASEVAWDAVLSIPTAVKS
jgi:L-aminopeptidase/D-esterase-like protein